MEDGIYQDEVKMGSGGNQSSRDPYPGIQTDLRAECICTGYE